MIDTHLKVLNKEQKQAVTTFDKALIVLAGPGSGKTRVITSRVAELILNRNVDPSTIVVVTFTNKAANEMKSRIVELVGHKLAIPLKMGTFHSIMARFLRIHAKSIDLDPEFTIVDSHTSKTYIKNIINCEHRVAKFAANSKRFSESVVTCIQRLKCSSISPEVFLQKIQILNSQQRESQMAVQMIYEQYQDALKKANGLDFDDLLMQGLKLLTTCQDLAQQIQYVLVDEYQDTNVAQYRIIMRMCAVHKRLMIVADPDQSIYAFRFADQTNLTNIKKQFPNASVISLRQNYRSTNSILQSARLVISKLEKRQDRHLFTTNHQGHPVVAREFGEPEMEARFIAYEIQRLIKHNDSILGYGDFAVLVRTGAQTRALETEFINNGIPHKIIGGTRFFERIEIQDLMAYLRVAVNSNDTQAFLRTINTPKRKIGDVSINKIKRAAEETRTSLFDMACRVAEKTAPPSVSHISTNIREYVLIINTLRDMNARPGASVAHMLTYLVNALNFESYLDSLKELSGDSKTRMANVEELISLASTFDSDCEFDKVYNNKLKRFANFTALNTSHDENVRTNVNVSTLHAAKGLEWPIVFVAGVDTGKIPLSFLQKREEIEEERRLLYVGMTRAELLLYLTWPTFRPQPWGILHAPTRKALNAVHIGDSPRVKRSPFLDCLITAKDEKTGSPLVSEQCPDLTHDDMKALCRLKKLPIPANWTPSSSTSTFESRQIYVSPNVPNSTHVSGAPQLMQLRGSRTLDSSLASSPGYLPGFVRASQIPHV